MIFALFLAGRTWTSICGSNRVPHGLKRDETRLEWIELAWFSTDDVWARTDAASSSTAQLRTDGADVHQWQSTTAERFGRKCEIRKCDAWEMASVWVGVVVVGASEWSGSAIYRQLSKSWSVEIISWQQIETFKLTFRCWMEKLSNGVRNIK